MTSSLYDVTILSEGCLRQLEWNAPTLQQRLS